MTKKVLWSVCFWILALQVWAQNDEYVIAQPRNVDYIYKDYIRSVLFHPSEAPIGYPILALQSGSTLLLSFDDLEADGKDYSYKVVHCDANWEPTEELDPLDYIDGFAENRIFSLEHSFSTLTAYTHYELTFPNDDINITVSGNYLLKVFLNDDETDLAITRRFMVVDTKMKPVVEMRRSATPPNSATHQEMMLNLQHAGIRVGNPGQELSIVILQNGRWDNAVGGLEPTFVGNEELRYDMPGQLAFPGCKEFRPLDIRSFRYRTNQVEFFGEQRGQKTVELFQNLTRHNASYLFTHDINGHYIIETHDFQNNRLQGEYLPIHFKLKTAKKDKEVYLMGGLTDYQPYELFRLDYNEAEGVYEKYIPLKNGFYDFYYGVLEEDGRVNALPLEGSTFEAENDYLILVYWRPFGGRYDQLVAVETFNSNPNR